MDRFINAVLAGVAEGATYGLIALGIVLVYKATRVLNFAQAEIGTFAIYVMWILTEPPINLPVLLGVILALVFAGAAGAGTEYVLRPLTSSPRLTVTVATLGLGTVLGASQIILFGTDPHQIPAIIGGEAFAVGATGFVWGRILALLLAIGLGVALYIFVKTTLFGLGVLAAAQDQTALRLQGVPFNRVSVFTWSTGAVLTALAGIILAPVIGSVLPFWITQTFLVPSLAAALVGGLTSLPGAFVGGLIIGIAQNLAKFYVGDTVAGAEFVAVFALILVVLLFRPNGLMGREA
jgi:branched-chain amino acid transport system permease protein